MILELLYSWNLICYIIDEFYIITVIFLCINSFPTSVFLKLPASIFDNFHKFNYGP